NEASIMRNIAGRWDPYGYGGVPGALLLLRRIVEGTVPGSRFYDRALERARRPLLEANLDRAPLPAVASRRRLLGRDIAHAGALPPRRRSLAPALATGSVDDARGGGREPPCARRRSGRRHRRERCRPVLERLRP